MLEKLKQLAEQFAAAGVDRAFGVTGSGATWNLIDQLEIRGIKYFPVGHEAAGAIMAGGAWKANGKPALSLSIKGPGLLNSLPGIAYNHFENQPVVSIAESYGSSTPNGQMHKRVNQSSLLQPLVRGITGLNDPPNDIPQLWAASNSGVLGPVHVELNDLTLMVPPLPRKVEDNLGPALNLIAKSRKPILIVGNLARQFGLADQIKELRIPVFTTAAAKGIIDENKQWAAGIYTGTGGPLSPESSLMKSSDLIVGIGLRNLEIISPKNFDQSAVLMDLPGIDAALGFGASVNICHPSEDAFRELLTALTKFEWGDAETEKCVKKLDQILQSNWLPAACFQYLNQLDNNYSLIADTGSFCTVAEHIWKASPERPFVGSSNGRYMGCAIPTAIGYAAASQRRPVYCAVGDGGMRQYPGELKIAVEHSLPICVLFMSDGRYGSIGCAQGKRKLPIHAITMPGPSWENVVRGMGCQSRHIETFNAFKAAIDTWDNRSPLFLECVFDSDEYLLMTNNIR